MEAADYEHYLGQTARFMATYRLNIAQYKVRPPLLPKAVYNQLPSGAPEQGESFEALLSDFERIILPNMTHWQHPSFHAYFPANNSAPSILAEMLTAALGAQCMSWETSPAAAELEERMTEWLREACGLPSHWQGVIQDTASSATFCALLAAREQAADIGRTGFGLGQKFVVYASEEAHSSVDKAVRFSGIGTDNLRKIPVDTSNFSMRTDLLEAAIRQDLGAGFRPLWCMATLGTTGSTAMDNVELIGQICRQYGLWLHVDAAYAGNAAILPELRHLFEGLALAQSYVFNPHKWLFTNFDCTLLYVSDKQTLLNAFALTPEYLRTAMDSQVNNYRDWGIQLGRRFRALKLWFVLRYYGLEGLRTRLRVHIDIARYFAALLACSPLGYEIVAPVLLNLVCFRQVPKHLISTDAGDDDKNTAALNAHNAQLLARLNDSGEVFLSHTKLDGKFVLRAVFGQTEVARHHAEKLFALLERLGVNGER